MNFFWSLFPMTRSTKTPQKIRGKFFILPKQHRSRTTMAQRVRESSSSALHYVCKDLDSVQSHSVLLIEGTQSALGDCTMASEPGSTKGCIACMATEVAHRPVRIGTAKGILRIGTAKGIWKGCKPSSSLWPFRENDTSNKEGKVGEA